MSEESPRDLPSHVQLCDVCGELDEDTHEPDESGMIVCRDCRLAGRGIESEVWTGPLADWSAPYGGRS